MEINNIKPTGSKILIEVAEVAKQTSSGLIIADTATNFAPVTGKIINVGELSVYKIGQQVLFRRYSVDELKIVSPTGEQLFYFLEDADVLALVEGEVEQIN